MRTLLELFSGSGNVSAAFREQDWRTITLDSDKRHEADIQMNILNFEPSIHLPPDVDHVDLVWASPPCVFYSIMRQCNIPATEDQLDFSDTLVRKSLQIADELGCPILLENPWSGKLKNRGILDHLRVNRLDYCCYSRMYRKRTAVWSDTEWSPARPLCRYNCPATVFNPSTNRRNHAKTVRECNHRSAEIPKELCREIAEYFSRGPGEIHPRVHESTGRESEL